MPYYTERRLLRNQSRRFLYYHVNKGWRHGEDAAVLALYSNRKKEISRSKKFCLWIGGNVPSGINYIVEVKAILLYIVSGWPITSRAFFVESRRCRKISQNFFQKETI